MPEISQSEALVLAAKYDKDVVVIFTWDTKSNDLTASWGGSTELMDLKAADWAKRCSLTIGADIRSAYFHEPLAMTVIEQKQQLALQHAQLAYLSERLGVLAQDKDGELATFAIETLANLPNVEVPLASVTDK